VSYTRMVLAAAAFAALALTAAPAGAQGVHVGGIGLTGGLGGLGSGFNPYPGGAPPNISGSLGQFPMSAMSEEGNQKARLGYPDLRISGQIGVDPSKIPAGAQVVQLRLDGTLYPMVVESSSLTGGNLEQRGYITTKEMYRSALEKQLVVVGNPDLRRQLASASATHEPMEVEGYVFNRVSPYFVVRSVTVAQAK
jgi:hypothetical protein